MGRLSELGALPPHLNDRPLGEHWRTPAQQVQQWSRERLADNATAQETAGEVAEWLVAKAAGAVDDAAFDQAVSSREAYVASMVWGCTGDAYAALSVEVERRQVARGWRHTDRGWLPPGDLVQTDLALRPGGPGRPAHLVSRVRPVAARGGGEAGVAPIVAPRTSGDRHPATAGDDDAARPAGGPAWWAGR